jgi:hypothetical protein
MARVRNLDENMKMLYGVHSLRMYQLDKVVDIPLCRHPTSDTGNFALGTEGPSEE